jgi:hypothetical protein
VGDDTADDAQPLGFGGVEPAGRQEQIAGYGYPDVRRQGGRVGRVGDAAQQFGNPEGGPVAGHGDVGHHGDQQAARLADAIDGGHDGRPAVPDGQEGQNVLATEAVRQGVTWLGPAPEVAARGEHVARAGDDQRGQLRVLVD